VLRVFVLQRGFRVGVGGGVFWGAVLGWVGGWVVEERWWSRWKGVGVGM